MKTYSIEYAHIYTNNKINDEHQLSIDILGEFFSENQRSSSSLVVMVDDYSFPDPTFDYNEFITWLDGKGFKPDVVLRESQLIPACDSVLKIMEDIDLKEEIVSYIKSKKYPCSLFIAAWYLVRLGRIESSQFDKQFVAEKLVSILPESFKPFEEKAIEVISATPFKDDVNLITHKYFKGRMIA